MDTSTNHPTPFPGNADALSALPDDPPQSPGKIPATLVAQRRIVKAGGIGSPVRRSPRLSCLPPPQPPIGSHNAQDLDGASDDESESVYDVALHLSRDETPEHDVLPPDEPSSVLASRIMRAHDNPSPPPQDFGHPGINYVPGKDGQFPLPSVSVPPSAFRSINLLERLNQFSDPLFNPPCSPRTLPPSIPLDISGSPPRAFISSEPSSPFIASEPVRITRHEDPASADTSPSSFSQCAVEAVPSRPSQHLVIISSLLGSEDMTSPSKQVIDSAVPPDSNDSSRRPLSCAEKRHGFSKPLPLPPNSTALSPLPLNEDSAALDTKTIVTCGLHEDEKEISSVDTNSLPSSREKQESDCGTSGTKEVGADSLQRLGSLSPRSTEALEPTSLVQQTHTHVEPIEHPSATPPRTPTSSVTHTDLSRLSARRQIIAPTPARVNSPYKLNSTSKSSLEVDNVYRTPAKRVPIKIALACGNPSLQRAVQLSTGTDRSRPGRFLTIRPPVFTRPALDDPSRSPAKRIPIADSVASPTRGCQTQCSPVRPGLVLRARSASVEPHTMGTAITRSRSVEPGTTESNGKIQESFPPTIPTFTRAGTKLPFPLVPDQKSSNNLPSPIHEEDEDVEARRIRTDDTLSRPRQGNTISHLRQPPTNSRIPRIGNKPYARPPKNGRTTVNTTMGNTTHASRAPPFQLAMKNRGAGDSNVESSSIQVVNDRRLVGSLKRKRGAEATVPPPHPVMIRQVVPGILSDKYAPKPAKPPSQVQAPPESSQPKVTQPLKFRKVVDGMLSARYTAAKANLLKAELLDSTSPPSPLSELSSSDEGSSDEKPPPVTDPPACHKSKTSETPRTGVKAPVVEASTHESASLSPDVDDDKSSNCPRRTSRARKPAQQQYVLDVFSGNISTRPAPARRKPQPRAESDYLMGMSATALKALTTSNTTKNQQPVAVLATEVIRRDGLRPESPTVKARTILQKQRDERDMRRKERAQRKAKMNEENLGDGRGSEGQSEVDDGASFSTREDHGKNDCDVSQKHRRGPGDEEDYETPERLERGCESLRLEGLDGMAKCMKQVKWHRGLSTAIYLDEVDPKPKPLPKNVVARGCLAPTSKNLPLDSLGNLVDMDNRPFPGLGIEHVIVKRYLYDNDIEPEPAPMKMTRSRSKKSKG